MWNGPQNKPQGRQCVTHRRPQNLCLKRVPKTVPMKAQNVETVPDKLPNFHCHFIRRLTDISERALKTWLKNHWDIFETLKKHTKNIVQTSFKYPWIISKTFLKHLSQNYSSNDFSAYWILDVALYEVDTFVGSFVYDAIEHVRKSKIQFFIFLFPALSL